MSELDLLKQAVDYIKAGQKEEARKLLTEVLKNNPRQEHAWLWMSAAVQTREERIQCLKRVLEINPNNDKARTGLQKLHVVKQKETPKTEPCPACGFLNREQAKFCSNCGKALHSEMTSASPPERELFQSPPLSPPSPKPAQASGSGKSNTMSLLDKLKHVNVIAGLALGIIALVICIGSSVFAYRFMKNLWFKPVATDQAPAASTTIPGTTSTVSPSASGDSLTAQSLAGQMTGYWENNDQDGQDKIIFSFGAGEQLLIITPYDAFTETMTYSIDDSFTPAHLELQTETGEEIKAIIELITSNTMRIGLPVTDERPTTFEERTITFTRLSEAKLADIMEEAALFIEQQKAEPNVSICSAPPG